MTLVIISKKKDGKSCNSKKNVYFCSVNYYGFLNFK